MLAIVNTSLILEDGILFDGTLLLENGRILLFGARDDVQIPEGAEILDAGGCYTAPGLVDIHNHGAGQANFNEEPDRCAEHFLRHGETTVLPAFYMNLTREEMLEGARRVRAAMTRGAGRIIAGLYMEGPYMGAFGSFQDSIRWNGPIREADYMPLVDELGSLARVWAIDPARENVSEFMKYARRVNPDAVFALGHSHASAGQCREVKPYGVRVQTHHGDSGKAKGRAQGIVGAGCDEFSLYDPDMYAEVICDENGIHLDSDMLKLVVRAKGVERVILITDSMASKESYSNNEAEGIAYGPDLNYDSRGYLGGSRLTLENACRNIMRHTGYGLCHAIRFASLNPARLLGMDGEIGSIAVGKRANLIVIDDKVRIKKVLLDGQDAGGEGQGRAIYS